MTNHATPTQPANVIVFPPDPEGEDRPPRCGNCHYALIHLTEPHCPECGQWFNPDAPWTYTRKPRFEFWLFVMPLLVLVVGCGFAWAAVFYSIGHLGLGAFLGVPFMMGLVIWYVLPARPSFLIGFVTSGIGAVILLLVLFGFAGLFCGLLLIPIFLLGAYAAMIGGFLVTGAMKAFLRRSRYAQRDYLGVIILLLLPGFLHVAEVKLMPAPSVETVRTAVVLEASREQAWRAWMFYEEVEHDPPWTLRAGFPKPVGVQRKIQQAGDVEVCIYDKGRLVKRATRVEPGVALEFEVIGQHNIEDRSLTLLDGGFSFTPTAPGQTRVELTTRYQPKLTPRTLWRPIEHHFAHTLHRHVLEGMQRRVDTRIVDAATAQERGG